MQGKLWGSPSVCLPWSDEIATAQTSDTRQLRIQESERCRNDIWVRYQRGCRGFYCRPVQDFFGLRGPVVSALMEMKDSN